MNSSTTDDNISSRHTLLDDASRSLGKAWAEGWFDDLRREGRPVAGGWPGTMSEARSRASIHMTALLARRAMQPATHDELAQATRVTYDSAKAVWLGGRVRGAEAV